MRRSRLNVERDVVDGGQNFAVDGEALRYAGNLDLWCLLALTAEVPETGLSQRPVAVRVEGRHVAMKLSGVGRGRGGEYRGGSAGFLYGAVLEDHDGIRALGCDR